jgi:hypothetical protein
MPNSGKEGAMKAVTVFSGSGPLLILTSYPSVDDPRFVAKLQAKGVRKFMAWEVGIERCREVYGYGFRDIVADLQREDDLRVLDFDGHRIFLNFSLAELREPFVFEQQESAAIMDRPANTRVPTGSDNTTGSV